VTYLIKLAHVIIHVTLCVIVETSECLKNWWDRGLIQELEDDNEIGGTKEGANEVAEALMSLFVFCCAQQTGMHIAIVEALLIL
jgi:hypothetical protein